MTGQIVFIVWRESVEALLVIGILATWLAHTPDARGAMRYLWGGVGAGIALALGLAWAIYNLAAVLPPDALEYFMVAMMLLAAALIVQMVLWMRAHGRRLKAELEGGLQASAERGHWWGIFLLAMIAVAREGSETVIFVYGMVSAAPSASLLGAVAAGIALALASYGVLQLGGRILSWRLFFRVTEVMLLALGAALLVAATDKLASLGVLPYTPAVWDSSWLLDDSGRLGGIIAALTGYRATPDRVTLAVWAIYWGAMGLALHLQNRRHAPAPQAADPSAAE